MSRIEDWPEMGFATEHETFAGRLGAELFAAIRDEVTRELWLTGRTQFESDDLRVTVHVDATGEVHTVVETKP